MASCSYPLWESRFWQHLPTRISRFTTSNTLLYISRCIDNMFKGTLILHVMLIPRDIFSWLLILRHRAATTCKTASTRVTTNLFD